MSATLVITVFPSVGGLCSVVHNPAPPCIVVAVPANGVTKALGEVDAGLTCRDPASFRIANPSQYPAVVTSMLVAHPRADVFSATATASP